VEVVTEHRAKAVDAERAERERHVNTHLSPSDTKGVKIVTEHSGKAADIELREKCASIVTSLSDTQRVGR